MVIFSLILLYSLVPTYGYHVISIFMLEQLSIDLAASENINHDDDCQKMSYCTFYMLSDEN